MARRRGEENPNTKYYNEFRNGYYNPDDEINRPGVNVNWKDIQQGFFMSENTDKEQNNRLDAVEAKNTEQDARLDAIEEKNTEQDARLDAIEEKDAEQDARLSGIEEKNTEQDARLDAIETEQTAQNNRLDAIEAKDVAQDARLDAIEAEQTTQNNRLDSIEAKDVAQDARLNAIEAEQVTQNTQIETNRENIAAHEIRLDNAEQNIQNETARNTAQDAAIADNSARITRIEDYGPRISVIEAEQAAQNNRLDAIEAKDAAQDADIALLQSDITDLQAADQQFDRDLDGLDTRISSVEDAINTRLTAVEQVNAQQDATLSNHETRIADNTARNTAQETAIADNSARITRLEQGAAGQASTTRDTPTDPDQPRETVIGDSSSNVTIEAAKNTNGESLVITDTANGDSVSVGFTSDQNGDNIIVGGNTYKLGSTPIKHIEQSSTTKPIQNIAAGSYANGVTSNIFRVNEKPDTLYKCFITCNYIRPATGSSNYDKVLFTYFTSIGEFTTDSNGSYSFPAIVYAWFNPTSSSISADTLEVKFTLHYYEA